MRVVLHQIGVVVHQTLDEGVVLRPLVFRVDAVYEQPLHPVVADATRIAGEVHPRCERLAHRAADAVAFGQAEVLVVGEVRRFLHPDDLVGLSLVLQHVALRVAVAELDPRAVGEQEVLRALLVHGDAVEQLAHRQDVVLAQLAERPPQQQDRDPLVAQRQQNQLHTHRPAFAAAPRASVGHIPALRMKKRLLLGIWRKNDFFHHSDHSRAFPSKTTVASDTACSGLSE